MENYTMAISNARRTQENQTILNAVKAQKGLVRDLHVNHKVEYVQLSHVAELVYRPSDDVGRSVALFEGVNQSINQLVMHEGIACLSTASCGVLENNCDLPMAERATNYVDFSGQTLINVVAIAE